jgi:uncharacterized membrane protein YdjX (TVP38/TMEM64 family)
VRAFLLRYGKLLGVLGFVVLVVVLEQTLGLREHLNVQYLQQQLHGHLVTALVLFVTLFAVANMLHLPGWIFLAAAVYAFGRLDGGVLTYVAASVSCVTTFVLIRLLGGNMSARLNHRFAVRLLAQLHAHPVRNVVILRTALQTLPTLNYALALSGMRLRDYVLGTLLGLPLPIAVYCLFFDYLITAAHKL